MWLCWLLVMCFVNMRLCWFLLSVLNRLFDSLVEIVSLMFGLCCMKFVSVVVRCVDVKFFDIVSCILFDSGGLYIDVMVLFISLRMCIV